MLYQFPYESIFIVGCGCLEKSQVNPVQLGADACSWPPILSCYHTSVFPATIMYTMGILHIVPIIISFLGTYNLQTTTHIKIIVVLKCTMT